MVIDKPLRKMSFLEPFSGLKIILFYPKYQIIFPDLSSPKKYKLEKIWCWDKNHGLSPLENVDVLHFLKVQFSGLKNHSFLSIRSKNNLYKLLFSQKKRRKSLMFGQKPWIIPFGKSRCFALFKTLYCWSKNSSLLSRISKNNIFWLDFSKKKK